jgi:hypothetical protein
MAGNVWSTIDFRQMNQSPSLPGGSRNPFRVDAIRAMFPRVARSSQPWADGHNPFGIASRSHAPPVNLVGYFHGMAIKLQSPERSGLSSIDN